jgi:hypothetical protein
MQQDGMAVAFKTVFWENDCLNRNGVDGKRTHKGCSLHAQALDGLEEVAVVAGCRPEQSQESGQILVVVGKKVAAAGKTGVLPLAEAVSKCKPVSLVVGVAVGSKPVGAGVGSTRVVAVEASTQELVVGAVASKLGQEGSTLEVVEGVGSTAAAAVASKQVADTLGPVGAVVVGTCSRRKTAVRTRWWGRSGGQTQGLVLAEGVLVECRQAPRKTREPRSSLPEVHKHRKTLCEKK